MRSPAELVTLANESFVQSFRTLADHCDAGAHRTYGAVFAFVTGLPVSLFNGCTVVEHGSEAELVDALDWLAGHDLPKRVFVAASLAPAFAGVLAEHGFGRDEAPYPALVLHPVSEPPEPSGGVEIVRVDNQPEAFREVGVALGLEPELTERMFPESMFADARVQAFVGRLDGVPVGYALAIASEHANGVYNVATLPDARRRGVGTALTWAAVDAGRRAGFDCSVLQSTPMARGIYEGMGFRWVLDYAVFRPTPTGQETPVPPSPQ
jgi:ribosomal protein S18 acetylase RimI-like enzyme